MCRRGLSKTGERIRCGGAARALVLLLVTTGVALGAAEPEHSIGGLLGVVTYSDPSAGLFYCQTSSAGFRVTLAPGIPAPSPGDLVRVDGAESEVNGPLAIAASSVRVVGRSSAPISSPLRTDVASAGRQLGRSVETTCVVHSAMIVHGGLDLELATDESDFEAHVLAPGLAAMPERLVDARVWIRAVCGPRFKRDGQITGYVLLVQSLADVVIVDPGPADPFATPVRAISSLLHGSPNDDDHRIHLSGVVTLQRPGDAIFLQDDSGGIYVSTDQVIALVPGNRVDVLGYLTTVDSFPSLYDAEVRSSGSGPEVSAVHLTPASLLAGNVDSRLVEIEGTLQSHVVTGSDAVLALEEGGVSYSARLRNVADVDRIERLGDGSRLRIKGVCAVRVDDDSAPKSFILYPRSFSDVVVMRAPPYWNFDRLLWMLGAAGAIGAAVVAWVVVLRRRVRLQTAVIRRQVESEIALDRRYRDLVERATDVIYTRTSDGAIVSVNASGELVSGYSREELLRLSVRDLVVSADRPGTSGGAAGETFELEIRRKDTKHRVLEVREHPLDGEPDVLLGIARDVTEPRRLSGQLQQAQRMECVGRLAGGVAHDFNNLLTVISGYGSIALDAIESGRKPAAELRAVLAAGERAASLTRHLLAFSRKQVFKMQPLDLNDTITQMGPMFRRLIGEDVAVDFRSGENIGIVSADVSQIEQVLMNLVVNARDAMPNGGQLFIETGSEIVDEARERRYTDARPGAFVTLSVSDTGTGIDPSLLEHIFDPFFTTKSVGKGTGLGLSTVYGVVTQSGGWIEVESTLGSGTRFVVFLPRVDTPADVASAAPEPVDDLPSGRETILVVEDEPTVRALAAQVLRGRGYRVVEAGSGEEALDRHTARNERIDLVITDVILPGMNGKELATALSLRSPSPRVLFMSGYTDDVIGRHGVLEEGVSFLAKPFTPGAIARKVRTALDEVVI